MFSASADFAGKKDLCALFDSPARNPYNEFSSTVPG